MRHVVRDDREVQVLDSGKRGLHLAVRLLPLLALVPAAEVDLGLDAELVDVERLEDVDRNLRHRSLTAVKESLAHLDPVGVHTAAHVAEVEAGLADHARRDVLGCERADVRDDLRAGLVLARDAPPVLRAELEVAGADRLRAKHLLALRLGLHLLDDRLREVLGLRELDHSLVQREVGLPGERLPGPLLLGRALHERLGPGVEHVVIEAVLPLLHLLVLGAPGLLPLRVPLVHPVALLDLLLGQGGARRLLSALLEVLEELLHAGRVRVVRRAILRRGKRDRRGEQQ